jgi:hypothetical protein
MLGVGESRFWARRSNASNVISDYRPCNKAYELMSASTG